jgi:hypothetical protein
MAVGPTLARRFLENANGLTIWICFVVIGSILAFGILLWRFVPAAISLVLGIITWGAVVWMWVR